MRPNTVKQDFLKIFQTFFLHQTPRFMVAILLLLSFTSCIEICEEFHFNGNGGGTYIIRVDGGEAAIMLNLLNKSYLNDFEKEFRVITQKSAKALEGNKGISNIKITNNKSRAEFIYQFDFEKSGDLNKGIYSLLELESSMLIPKIYKVKKKAVKKRNIAPVARLILNKEFPDLKDNSFLKYVDYKVIYHLPDSLKRVKSPVAPWLDGRDAVFTYPVDELLNTGMDIGHKIRF